MAAIWTVVTKESVPYLRHSQMPMWETPGLS